MRTLSLALALSVSATASAQPAPAPLPPVSPSDAPPQEPAPPGSSPPDAPPPDASPPQASEPSEATPPPVAPPPPPTPIAPIARDPRAAKLTTTAETASRHGDCVAVRILGERVRQLDPAYHDAAFATNTLIMGCRQGVQLDRANPQALEAPTRHPPGATSEIEIGGGGWSLGDETLWGLGGPSFGFGKFVGSQLAFSVRIAGATHVGDDFYGYLGTIGPHLQYWPADQVWIGGGIGLGVLVGCSESCDSITGTGYDLRLGYAFQPRGVSGSNLSFEITDFSDNGFGIKTVSLLIGYQSF